MLHYLLFVNLTVLEAKPAWVLLHCPCRILLKNRSSEKVFVVVAVDAPVFVYGVVDVVPLAPLL